jgi:hypothetical protein
MNTVQQAEQFSNASQIALNCQLVPHRKTGESDMAVSAEIRVGVEVEVETNSI